MNAIRQAFIILVLYLCKINAARIRPRILDGQDAQRGQFPYFVSLVDGTNQYHFCGGSIISHWHILTAAHCLNEFSVNEIWAVLGATEFDKRITVTLIDQMVIHPDYNAEYFLNDIAVLKVSDKIMYSDIIKPIAIDRTDYYSIAGTLAVMCGFGVTSVSLCQCYWYENVKEFF